MLQFNARKIKRGGAMTIIAACPVARSIINGRSVGLRLHNKSF
jgi:hypothetical protein